MADYSETTESDLARAKKVLEDLTSNQRDLLIGLGHGAETTRSLLRNSIPTGTREYLVADEVIDPDGTLTELGRIVADEAAYERGEGPDPTLLIRAAAIEARPRLILNNVSAQTDEGSVDEVTLSAQPGEILSVVGPPGAGKTTLLLSIAGQIGVSGHVYIDGEEVVAPRRGWSLRRARPRTVFSAHSLHPHTTAIENVALSIKGPRKERLERASEALESVGLLKFADRLPQELSGGMRQRLVLAKALAEHRGVILMDDLLDVLPGNERLDAQNELREQLVGREEVIVFTTKSLDEALNVGSRVAVMVDGRIVLEGDSDSEFTKEEAEKYISSA